MGCQVHAIEKGYKTPFHRQGHSSISPIGNIYSDHFGKAETLNSYFCFVFTTGSCDECPSFEEAPFPPILCINININGVQQLLENLNVQKSMGIASLKAYDVGKLIHVFQPSIQQGCVPSDWKNVNVVGSRSIPSNYHPVSLSCKQLEHIKFTLKYSLIFVDKYCHGQGHYFINDIPCTRCKIKLCVDDVLLYTTRH